MVEVNRDKSLRLRCSVRCLTVFLFAAVLQVSPFLRAQEIVDSEAFWTHDPSMIRCGDYFYVYSTGDTLEMRRSRNLHNWEYLGSVLDAIPDWVQEKIQDSDDNTVSNLWAPDIFYHNDKYYMNYSASLWGQNISTIALLSNVTLDPDDPLYEWVDEGEIISSADDTSVSYNTIDGAFVHDQSGQPWMAFGSFWSGVKLIRLDASTLTPADTTIYSLAWNPYTTYYPIEAAYIVYRNGYYYLFVNHDICCSGVDSTYKIMVGRSAAITGPYYDQDGINMMVGGGTLFAGSGDRWIGPGHASVVTVDDQDFVAFHAYDALNDGAHALRVHELEWDEEGWPVLGDSVVPDGEGVIGHWDFEDGTAETLMNDTGVTGQVGTVDLSGNDYHMYAWNEITGASFSADGVTPSGVGLSGRFDGLEDAYTPDAFINSWTPSAWTIELAVKLDTLDDWQTMIGRDGSSSGTIKSDFYFQKEDDNDHFRIDFYTVGGERYILDADFTVEVDQWYYLAAVSDGETLTLYADTLDGSGSQVVGTLALDTENDNSLATPEKAWTFGRGWHNNNQVDQISGNLDDVRFTGRALQPQEFLHYQCGAWGYLESDLNSDCDVDLDDFALFAADWVDDFSSLQLLAQQWLESTQPYTDGAVQGVMP